MPDEFREWAQDTLLATFAGMLFGGGKRWAEERSAGGQPGAGTDSPFIIAAFALVLYCDPERVCSHNKATGCPS
jgi:hypothetical protein